MVNDPGWRVERRERRLAEARELLGGACAFCGTTADLEFDHVDPDTKIDAVTVLALSSPEKFWAEVGKCQLLCARHHRMKSNFETTLRREPPAHGSQRRSKPPWSCRCDTCRSADKERNSRRWRSK